MEFTHYKLKDLVKIKNGKEYAQLNSGRVPVYGSGGIMVYVDDYLYDGESILLPRKGSLDNIQYVNGKFWTIDTTYWTIVNSNIAYCRYLYLYLTLLNTTKRNTGSTLPSMTFDTYYTLDVYLPNYETQVKTADAIFDLINKIENNNKINSELESLAKTIYDYWFLQFDFPNEEGKPYKSSGGAMEYNEELKMDIPKGWEVKPLGSKIVEQPKSQVQVGQVEGNEGDVPFFTSGDAVLRFNKKIVNGRNLFLNTGGKAGLKYYVGDVAYSTDTWCISGSDNLSDYLYLNLSKIEYALDRVYFTGSTGLEHLQKPLLKKREILVPPSHILDRFNKIVQPMFDMISENTRENQELSDIRDYLLPLLMNGQVGFRDE